MLLQLLINGVILGSVYSLVALGFALIYNTTKSLLIEILVYQPLEKKKSSNNIKTISSIGVMTIVINIVALFYGNETKIIKHGISGVFRIGNIIIVHTQLYQFVTAIVLIIAFLVVLKLTNFGIITRAMRDNNLLCSVFGLNLRRFRLLLFAISGFFAATGGSLCRNAYAFECCCRGYNRRSR